VAVSSEYHVNIVISSKDKTSQGAKTATKSLDALRIAATLAAAGFAALKVAQKAIDFVEFGASVQRAANAVESLAAMNRQSGQEIIAAIQEASDFTIDKMTAMEVANKAMLMGVAKSPEQFRELARTATILGRAMGLDAVTAIDRFTIAAGRKSVKVADDLGLLIDASIANDNYAKTLGKTVEELTAAEQSQAFLNAMMEAAEPKVRALEGANLDLKGSMEQVKTIAKDMRTDLADLAATYADVSVKQATFLIGGQAQLADFRTAWAGFVEDWKAAILAGAVTTGVALRGTFPTWEELAQKSEAEIERWGRYGMAVQDAANKTAAVSAPTDTVIEKLSGLEAQEITAEQAVKTATAALEAQTAAAQALAETQATLQQSLMDATDAQIAATAIGQLGTLLAEKKISVEDYTTAVTETQLAFGLADEQSIKLAAGILDLTTKFGEGQVKAQDFDSALLSLITQTEQMDSAAQGFKTTLDSIPEHKIVTIETVYTSSQGFARGPVVGGGEGSVSNTTYNTAIVNGRGENATADAVLHQLEDVGLLQ
jgi:hypothetical protein